MSCIFAQEDDDDVQDSRSGGLGYDDLMELTTLAYIKIFELIKLVFKV